MHSRDDRCFDRLVYHDSLEEVRNAFVFQYNRVILSEAKDLCIPTTTAVSTFTS
jgi:hypothetical protein